MRFELFRDGGVLKLRDLNRPRYKPIYVDFLDYFQHWERQKASLKKSLLAKAIGYKGKKLKILDATLGLAKDTFLFCLLGCEVLATEKSKQVFALVEDALSRAQADLTLKPYVENLRIENFDVRDVKENLSDRFDVVYIDPMYPDVKSTAAPQASMQILRDLLPAKNNAEEILKFALKKLNSIHSRAIIKRPPKAPLIEVIEGNLIHSYAGKAVRYDAYRPQTGLGS